MQNQSVWTASGAELRKRGKEKFCSLGSFKDGTKSKALNGKYLIGRGQKTNRVTIQNIFSGCFQMIFTVLSLIWKYSTELFLHQAHLFLGDLNPETMESNVDWSSSRQTAQLWTWQLSLSLWTVLSFVFCMTAPISWVTHCPFSIFTPTASWKRARKKQIVWDFVHWLTAWVRIEF